MIDFLLKIRTSLAHFGLWFGGSLILLAALVIGVDVILRRFFTLSVGGSDELAQFALAIGSTWAMAGALVDRFHIRVDSLYHRFPAWMQRIADFLSLLLFLFFFSLVAWHAREMVLQSWHSSSISNSALQIPMIIPQGIWLIGLVMFLLSMLITLVAGLLLLFSRRTSEITALMGVKSADEELAEELREEQATAEDTTRGAHA